MNPFSYNFFQRPNVVYTSINIRKIKFIAYIYVPFNQILDEKSYFTAKIEAVKHLHEILMPPWW